MKTVYGKLVRDKIPEIIIRNGEIPKTTVLKNEDFFLELNKKLQEEVTEYLEDYDIEELADIVEVIFALVKHKGVSAKDFEMLRMKKYEERGGFDKKICLVEVERG